MGRSTTILILFLAAILEAAGDALIRVGIHRNISTARVLLFGLGALLLFAYGWTVNAPPWDFGRLLGLYMVFFFVNAQLISWLFFRQPPSTPVMAGGLLIVSGGIVIACFQ